MGNCDVLGSVVAWTGATVMPYAEKEPCVYIMASRRNGTIYIGVTSDVRGRVSDHKQGVADGFTKKYGVKQLVYYEMHATMDEAIAREKQLKNWKRAWKLRLIEEMNPEWIDLLDEQTGTLHDGPADAPRLQR